MPARPAVRALVIVSLATLFNGDGSAAGDLSFSQDVRPILAEYCLHCHGPDAQQRQAGLRLDVAETGVPTAVVPGQPDSSEIVLRMTSEHDDQRMPPPEMAQQPSSEQIEVIRRWISQGAVFEGHWAYQPIRRPDIPAPHAATSTDIDRFIVSALEQQGLTLSPPANRRQWIRRASFDLIGLPPTAAEVDAFVTDSSPEAFQRVIDRLLESPRYGERWGRHWLDLARYADTHGGSAIGFERFPFSYTYRDYVINAFNDDLPYDQFVSQQLAADQMNLPPNDPALAALGFLTVGMQFRSVHDRIDDQIDVVTRGLMGMTVACARCHDHKFDAIPTTDYYALYATFVGSEPPELLPMLGQPPTSQAYDEYQNQLDHRRQIYGDMARDQAAVLRSRLRNQVGLYLTELAKGTPEQDVSAAFLSYRTDDVRPTVLNRWRDYLTAMPDDDPVFGPWKQLQSIPADQFATATQQLVESLRQQNGDPAAFADPHRLAIEPPKWNPLVLDALEKSKPNSAMELAAVYGNLFAEIHQGWLQALLTASTEAAPGAEIITDEDPRHAEINSSIRQQLRRHLYQSDTPTALPDELAIRMLNRTVSDNIRAKSGTIHQLHLNSPGSPPRAMVLTESSPPPTTHVFLRGNPLSRGEPVDARFLTVFADGAPQPFRDGQRRKGLAEAIVDPDNPLTRRVIVNWVWRHHFGLGLVRTPDDFGTRGDPPTHPQLLDHLATVFAEDGWSIKSLHRRIMLSDAYRQSASENDQARQRDPDNRWLWRMPRKRLEMEVMRDTLLAISAELDTSQIGGRPFDLESEPVVPRRSVFGFVNRDIISNLASTFDGADPTSCTVKRPDTIVPQQALYALNSDFIQNRAAAVAQLARQAADDDAERVDWLYRRIYSRQPDQQELDLALSFVQRDTQPDSANQSNADESSTLHGDLWAQLAHAMLASNELFFID